MNDDRRRFMSYAAGVALPAAAVGVAGSGVARAADGDAKEFLGAWTTIHSLPFPPNWFREFLTFSTGGGVLESNTFLNMAASQDFSAFGLPRAIKASDGMGTWELVSTGKITIVFRKLLFDGAGNYFADLKVGGTVQSDGTKIFADWLISAVDVNDKLLAPFGPATSEGTRIR